MRARYPDRSGLLERAGVEIYYEVHGVGSPTVLLVPASPITHSRIWKALIPNLARRHRVVTFDGRGSGRSGRPAAVEDHTSAANVADLVAVLDETRTAEAVVVAHCHANWWVMDLIRNHPDRVSGLVAIAPGVPHLGRSQPHWAAAARTWDQHLEHPVGWELFNRQLITTEHRRWVEFFFAAQLVETHSTKQYEDAVAWSLESTGEILAASEEAQDLNLPTRDEVVARCRSLDVPALVIHGTQDVCQHVDKGRELADLTGARLLLIEGGGHLPMVREPVRVNRAITDFVDGLGVRPPGSATWTRALTRRKRILYVSSPIGLGHVRRDLAIATELRRSEPEAAIDWLSQEPVTTVLHAAGERVHPASAWLASECGHLESEAAGHDLHCFQALRSMDEILVANFLVFQQVVEEGLYDLVIGDEAWDVDHFWHENPELKHTGYAWLTDFVGYLPMPDGGSREARLTADYNAEMIEHIDRLPRLRDRSVFVGNPRDIVSDRFGPGLPSIRGWTMSHFDFSGYITGFPPITQEQRAGWRDELGWGDGEPVCVVTIGGSGVGRALLDLATAAYPLVRRVVPGFRMVVVTGPRVDPGAVHRQAGLQVLGYVDRLYRHLTACDLAVVQGGLTSTMELAAARRPFLYFPLAHHFEQNFHVRHRLEQYRAGTCMDYATTDPDLLADTIIKTIGSQVTTREVETDGAQRAAALIAELL